MSEPKPTIRRNESGLGTVSVRAMIALILVVAVGLLAWRNPEMGKDVVYLATLACIFYFQQKPTGPPPAPPQPPTPPVT